MVNCDVILVVALANLQELIRAYETGWGCGWYCEKVSGKQNFGSSVEVLKIQLFNYISVCDPFFSQLHFKAQKVHSFNRQWYNSLTAMKAHNKTKMSTSQTQHKARRPCGLN